MSSAFRGYLGWVCDLAFQNNIKRSSTLLLRKYERDSVS